MLFMRAAFGLRVFFDADLVLPLLSPEVWRSCLPRLFLSFVPVASVFVSGRRFGLSCQKA
jgi:hypothetical protein